MQLLHTIETWVLEKACRQAALWPEHIVIAINVSPSLVVYTEIATTIAGILSATGLPAARLELEVTELAILDNDGQTRRKLGELKSLGVSLAMDDFGTGFRRWPISAASRSIASRSIARLSRDCSTTPAVR